MIQIKTFVFNPFRENTFLLYDETSECIIVDAGCNDENEFNELEGFINENKLSLKYVVNTHCHIDHILGNAYFINKYNVPFIAHKGEIPLLQRSRDMAIAFGFDLTEPPAPSIFIEEGEEIRFGNSALKVIHVPGHSPGSIVLYSERDQFILAGDVLFAGSIGRTDLPGGDYNTLISGITQKLLTLNDDVVVYPGHGETTTILEEKNTNPFF